LKDIDIFRLLSHLKTEEKSRILYFFSKQQPEENGIGLYLSSIKSIYSWKNSKCKYLPLKTAKLELVE